MEEKKSYKTLNIIAAVLMVFLIALTCYKVFIFDKKDNKNNKDNTPVEEKENNNEKETIKTGPLVKVKLSDTLVDDFYVLKSDGDMVTLLYSKNVGYSEFNTSWVLGNSYEKSVIKNKVDDLTSSWVNAKEKRLIELDELKATGELIEDNNSFSIKSDSWLYSNSIYWTMTPSDDESEDPNFSYVYVVKNNKVELEIVGKEAGTNKVSNAEYYKDYEIKPVIVIPKKYVITDENSSIEEKEENKPVEEKENKQCSNTPNMKYSESSSSTDIDWISLKKVDNKYYLLIDWVKANNIYGDVIKAKDKNEFLINNLDVNKVKSYKIISTYNAVGNEYVMFLMTDGTLEYIPIYKALTESEIKSYGKIKNVDNVVELVSASASPIDSDVGNYVTTIAKTSDGNCYNLYVALQK